MTPVFGLCIILPLFHTTFGLVVMGKLLLALVIPYQGTFSKLRYGIGFTIGAFK